MYLERMNQMRNEIYHREWRWMEQLSAAFHVFSAIIGAVMKVMAIIFLPISILQSVILSRMTADSQLLSELLQTGNELASGYSNVMTAGEGTKYMLHVDFGTLEQALMQTLTNEMLYFAIVLFLQPVGIIAIAKVVRQYIDAKDISVGKALSEAFSLMPTIIVTGIIYGVLMVLGYLVIVPGIYFNIAWGFYLFCIGLSGKKGWAALKYSKELVKGKWWRTFAYLWLLSIVAMLWNSVFQLIYVFVPAGTASDILYQFLCYFSLAFVAAGKTLLFINREAITFGVRPGADVPAAEMPGEDGPAESVEGTVEGEPVEQKEEKKDE